jgi:hypothetical protein
MNKAAMTPAWLSQIYYHRLRFYFRARQSGEVPYFIGPEIRGSIGRQLKQSLGCRLDQDEDCRVCPERLKEKCVYARYFPHRGNLPSGMVLALDALSRGNCFAFSRGDSLRFDLVLPGGDLEAAGALVGALKKSPLILGAGYCFDHVEAGFIDEGGRFKILGNGNDVERCRLRSKINPPASNCDHTLQLVFQTPTELTLKHGYYLRRVEELTFSLLVLRMLERTATVARAFEEWVGEDDKRVGGGCEELIEQSGSVTVSERRAVWRKVPLRAHKGRIKGGLVGTVSFQGNIAPFLPLFEAVSLIGIGKNTSHGFGQVSWLKIDRLKAEGC